MQQIISSSHFEELKVAAEEGLLPDSWMQTGTIAAVVHNQYAKSVAKPESFIPKVKKPLSVEDQAKLGQRFTAPVTNSLNRRWQISEA